MLISLIKKRFFVTLLFGISLLLLTAIGLISYYHTQNWLENRDEVMAARENVLNYEKLLSALKDAETGQRGYIITGDSAYLEPFMASKDSIKAIRGRLDAYPGPDLLTQQTNLRIENLISRRLTLLDDNLILFERNQRNSPSPEIQRLRFGKGKELMDSLRLEIKQLQAYKSQLLRAKTNELSDRSSAIMRAQWGGTLVGILLLVWAFILLRQEMKKRQQSLLALEEVNNTLEQRVQERTEELHSALEELNASNEELYASNEALSTSNEQQSALLSDLNNTQQRLNLALETARMGVWKWDLKTDLLEWDSNLESVYDLSKGEFKQKYGATWTGFQQLIHSGDVSNRVDIILEAIQKQTSYKTEYRIVTPAGQVRWILGQGTVMVDEQGEPIAMIGIDMDITDRKLGEVKILESEERFRSMADTSPVLIWMCSEEGLYEYFNKTWLDYTGRTLEQEVGNGWIEGVHPDDLKRCLEVYRNAMVDRKPFKIEYRLRRYDGSYCWMLDHGVPRFLPDGTFIGFIGSCMNIHERVEAEAKLKRLFDSDMLGVIEWSFQEGIFAANDAFLEMTGYTRKEMNSGRINWAELTPPAYQYLDQQAVKQVQQTGKSIPYEKELIRKDGSRVWVLVGAALLDKKLETGIAFVMDITVQQAATKKLRQSEERFRVAIESSPILVFNCDCSLRYTWVYNNAPSGNSSDEWLIGKTDREIMEVPEEAERIMNLKRQVIQSGVGRKEEVQVTINGQRHYYILTLEPLRDSNDKATGLTCATFDITEQKATEARIRESEAKLRRLFDSGMMGIVLWNREGEITDANETFLKQVGYTQEDLKQGKINWVAMTPPEYAERDALSLQELKDTGISIPFEKEYIRKDGSRIPILVGAATLEASEDHGIAFILDITDQKITEERVKKSERLLYEVFENSADALFLINVEGNIVERYNQQAVVLFDLEDKQKYIGLEMQNLQKHPFREREAQQILEQLAARGFWTAELEYVTMKGREFWGNAAVSFIQVDDQQYYLIRIRDITERKRFEEKLQKNQQVLESIFEGVADALFLIDPSNAQIVNCNQQVMKLFEFENKEDVIGLNSTILQKKPFTTEETHQIRREIWTKRYWTSEVEYVSKKGRDFWGDIAITVVPFEDKEYLLVRVGDITERKHYQEMLRQNQQEILRQKQRTEEALAIIAEDNERKTQELEEARALQISMLPQEPPILSYLDVAVMMKTSVEVGGDYYDYKLHENGDITLVIGDATGHGLKAGIVVATVKSYFQTLAGQYEAVELLEHISEGIQNLQIRGMYMGLTVMHFSKSRLLIASSGMPPLYLYRKATGQLETILLKGLFLGSKLEMPIEQKIIDIHPGDTFLAMTDGLPELFDGRREMLDYERIESQFKESGHLRPQQIIDQLLALGYQWNNGAPNEDDITLLVIKIK